MGKYLHIQWKIQEIKINIIIQKQKREGIVTIRSDFKARILKKMMNNLYKQLVGKKNEDQNLPIINQKPKNIDKQKKHKPPTLKQNEETELQANLILTSDKSITNPTKNNKRKKMKKWVPVILSPFSGTSHPSPTLISFFFNPCFFRTLSSSTF